MKAIFGRRSSRDELEDFEPPKVPVQIDQVTVSLVHPSHVFPIAFGV